MLPPTHLWEGVMDGGGPPLHSKHTGIHNARHAGIHNARHTGIHNARHAYVDESAYRGVGAGATTDHLWSNHVLLRPAARYIATLHLVAQ